MKNSIKLAIVLFSYWFTPSFSAYANDNHEAEEGEHHDSKEDQEHHGDDHSNKEGKKQEVFKVSEQAIKNYSITHFTLKGQGQWVIPLTAIARIRDEVALYVKSSEGYKRVVAQVVSRKNGHALVTSPSLKQGDLIASTGVSYLRFLEVSANSSDSGHEH